MSRTRQAKPPPAPPPTVVYRDPTEEGEFMWGCHLKLADEMAACTENSGDIYNKLAKPLYEAWDAHMLHVATTQFPAPDEVRKIAFRYLLEHGDALLQATKKELDRACGEPQAYNDAVIRDWFCWLYRNFRQWKQDSVR